ncbi:MAG: L,D-transpeptidase [Candidatus Sericytochromatia bacterium]|nr:L,D-transpeptidase [Candidatus Sericytochromatia bacterium]
MLSYWLMGLVDGGWSWAFASRHWLADDVRHRFASSTDRVAAAAPPAMSIADWARLPALMRNVEVDIPRQRLYLNEGKAHRLAFVVSTGINISTPRGAFHVIEKLQDPPYGLRGIYAAPGSQDNPLGAAWIGLNARHWRTGTPIGIHGTNEPERLGTPVSHGCVRLKNDDVLQLLQHVPDNCPVVIHD